MKIGYLQFSPQVGDVNNNLNRADAVLNRANFRDLDHLVLPEMAFSGYNFRSMENIAPFLEPTCAGITSLWARTVALKYDCTIICGYPEKANATTQEYYNSVIMVSADGDTLCNYRKSFLFPTDETWALRGDGFMSGALHVDGLGDVAMGIGIDLNPSQFDQAPWTAWEFAHHALYVEANVVVLTMAWRTSENFSEFSQKPHEPDVSTLSHWLVRLEPIIRAEIQGEIVVVLANRCGTEDGGVVYAGTSAVIGLDGGEVKLYGILGRGEKELLVVDTDGPWETKLVAQPRSATSAKSADDVVLERDPEYEPSYKLKDLVGLDFNADSPEQYYDCVSPVSATTDSLSPQAYFRTTNFNLGPSLRSSIVNPALASPTFQTPVSGVSRYGTSIGQSIPNSLDEMLKPGYNPFGNSSGRTKPELVNVENFESSFTRNPLGPRSLHVSPHPASTVW